MADLSKEELLETSLKDLAKGLSEEPLNPTEYFNRVKEKKNHITDEELKKIYDNCLELLNKYALTGQIKGMHKLMFHLECITKEREIVKMGINTFIYRDDIEEYIDNIAKDIVKITELSAYEREIPDDIVEIITKVKDKFDELYVLYTDYTGTAERELKKEKDPILFGTFQNVNNKTVIDRFYYLGDWVDEYCDLTLDKMVNQTKQLNKRNIIKTITTPQDIQQFKQQLENLQEQDGVFRWNKKHLFNPKPKSLKPRQTLLDKLKHLFKK